MYQFIKKLQSLYELLQDQQSKDIFLARFSLDMERTISHFERLVSSGSFKDKEFMYWLRPLKERLKKLNQEHKKIILYGTGLSSRHFVEILQSEHIDFYGFCGKDAAKFPNGLYGKPVLSPDELCAHGDEYYILLAVSEEFVHEISEFLQEHNYPKEHILDWVYIYSGRADREKQYFEFPELYHRNTAFIDGGCCNCDTSFRFIKWCGGEYSSIIAFEPDPDNYEKCCEIAKDAQISNFQIIEAGLSEREGTVTFEADGTAGSRIINTESVASSTDNADTHEISIRTVAIDDIVGDCVVGFIKMDIEGAELDALHGAKNTILRDKPLLAISVYHLQGDVFAIMDYLHQLLPEYRFLLRHYGEFMLETVLYASVDL